MAEELKPCPFCGSTNIDPAEWSGNDGKSGPGCGECGALGESIETWNRRATPPSPSIAEDEMPPLPKQFEELRARWKCEDCDGRGHDGELHWQGNFQPPEPATCGTCGGNGWVECEAFVPEQVIEYGQECARAALKGGRGGGHLDALKTAETRMDTGYSGGLLAELDWCIEEGCNGPRSHEALVRARAALSANAADREAKETAARTLEQTGL